MHAPASSWTFLSLALLGLLMTVTGIARATRLGWATCSGSSRAGSRANSRCSTSAVGCGCALLLVVERRIPVSPGAGRARDPGACRGPAWSLRNGARGRRSRFSNGRLSPGSARNTATRFRHSAARCCGMRFLSANSRCHLPCVPRASSGRRTLPMPMVTSATCSTSIGRVAAARRPVLLQIHGGGWIVGTSTSRRCRWCITSRPADGSSSRRTIA